MKKVNSLGFKIPFVICYIVVLIIIVMLISSVNIASSGISKSRLGGFNSTIAGYASVLDTWFDLQTSIISTYSVTPTVVKYLENDVNFTEELLSETINKFKNNNLYLINFGIADSEGDIFLDSMSSSALGKNLKDYIPDAWNRFVASNTDGVVYADKLVQSEITSKWAMPAIKPVKDSYNITIGYIYIFLDWYMLHQTHFANIDLGKTGGLFITTDKLYNIMDSLYENIAVMKINPIYEEAFKSGNISGNLTYNLGGQKRTAAYHKLKNQPWIIALAMMNYEIYEQNMKLIIAISIIGIISIVILAILVNLFIRTITKPLEIVVEEASKIEQGDLSRSEQRIKSRKDEIGILSKSFVSMRNKLIETITEVNEASNNIVNAAKELSSSNTDLSRRTESQAASLEETASSMEEMASTIKSSTDYAITGNNMMVSSKEAIESAGSIITETTKNIEAVYEASTKIKNITKIIEDIAFQTNILALNAAVEAARAGDQGKGFAVVASEVRNLAQTTQSSVKDITDLVDNTNEKINKATETAHQSQEIFIDIQQKIDDTAKIMQNISSTAMEQQAGVDQVNIAVSEMDTVTQHNASLVQESAYTSEDLLNQARSLQEAISFFKLSSSDIKISKEDKPNKKADTPPKKDDIKKVNIQTKPAKKDVSISSDREFGETFSSSDNVTDDGFSTF